MYLGADSNRCLSHKLAWLGLPVMSSSLVCFSWRGIRHHLASTHLKEMDPPDYLVFLSLRCRRKHLKPLFKHNEFRFSPKSFLAMVQIVNRCTIQTHTVFAFLIQQASIFTTRLHTRRENIVSAPFETGIRRITQWNK